MIVRRIGTTVAVISSVLVFAGVAFGTGIVARLPGVSTYARLPSSSPSPTPQPSPDAAVVACDLSEVEASYDVRWDTSADGFSLHRMKLAGLPACKGDARVALYDGGGADLYATRFPFGPATETLDVATTPLVRDVHGLRIGVSDPDAVDVPGLCAAHLFSPHEVVSPSRFDNVFTGTDHEDTVHGTWRRDLIVGYEAPDRLSGFTIPGTVDDLSDGVNDAVERRSVEGILGGDCIDGGEGDDRIAGHIGNDVLIGGTGDDVIWGGPGHDVIDGGDGYDVCVGGTLDGESALTDAVWRDRFENCEEIS